MKLSKKLFSLLLCAVMVLGTVAVGGNGFAEVLDAFSVKASATSITRDKAVSWARSLEGKYIDVDKRVFDGAGPYQCSDVATYYMNYLWITINDDPNDPYGKYPYDVYNANYYDDLVKDNCNWTVIPRTSSTVPQPGDIFVSEYGTYGHIGIVLEPNGSTGATIIHQNYNYTKNTFPNGYGCALVEKVNWNNNVFDVKCFIRFNYFGCDHSSHNAKAEIEKWPTATTCGTRRRYCECGQTSVTEDIHPLPYTSIGDGIFTIKSAMGETYVSSVSDKNIKLWKNSGIAEDQKWKFTRNSDGTYTIENKYYSGYCMDVDGGSMLRGANIQTYQANGTDAQKFYVVPKDGHYEIINKKSLMAIDAEDSNTANGTNISQWSTHGGTNQLWDISPLDIKVGSKPVSSNYNPTAGSTITISWGAAINAPSGLDYCVSLCDYSDMIIYGPKWTTDTSMSFTVDKAGTYYAHVYIIPGGAIHTYDPSDKITVKPATYTVSYNANGGFGPPGNQTKTNGVALTLSSTKPTRSGFTFSHWNTKADGTGSSYAAGASYTANASVTFYAQWVDTTKPTGSISSTNNVASSQNVTLSMSDNAGLAGYYWGTSSTYSNNTYTSISGASNSVTKAVSSPGTYYLTVRDTSGNISSTVSKTFYKITLNANSGSVSPEYVITMSGNSFTLPTPTRSGYSFKNWNTSPNGAGTSVTGTFKPSGSISFYAQWTDIAKPTGSISSTNNIATSQKITLSISDNNGLAGYYWGTSSSYLNNTFFAVSGTNYSVDKTIASAGTYYLTVKDTTSNISNTASISFYKINFDPNGGSVDNKTAILRGGYSVMLPIPKREGYSFEGWNTKLDGSGTNYQIQQKFKANDSITLYAQWKDIEAPKINVSWSNYLSKEQTASVTITDNLALAGYYWGTSSTYTNNEYVPLNENLNRYSLSFDINATGTYYLTAVDTTGNAETSIQIIYSVVLKDSTDRSVKSKSIYWPSTVMLPKLEKEGYVFNGWQLNNKIYKPGENAVLSQGSTIYAIWENIEPIYHIDSVVASTGAVTVSGWAFDPNYNKSVLVHIYIGGDERCETAEHIQYVADDEISKITDLKYDTPDNYGINAKLPTSLSGQQDVYIYVEDLDSVGDSLGKTFISKTTVNIDEDSEKPTAAIKSHEIRNKTKDVSILPGKVTTYIYNDKLLYATFEFSDNAGVVGYYWGSNSDYTKNEYFELPIGKANITQEVLVDKNGRLYLTCVDASGQVSETVSCDYCRLHFDGHAGYYVPGGTNLLGHDSSYSMYINVGGTVSLDVPFKKTNYHLAGWEFERDSSVKYTPSDKIQISEEFLKKYNCFYDIDFEAIWEKHSEVDINYYDNFGNTEPIGQSHASVGGSFMVSGGISHPGYTFAGWNTSPDGTGTSYYPGDKVENCYYNMNLYAQWDLIAIREIQVDFLPRKLVYHIYDDLETEGLVLRVTHIDGSVEMVTKGFTAEAEMITGGKKDVTVTYHNLKTTYPIEVLAPHNVTFMVNGEVYDESVYFKGDRIIIPDDPEIENNHFVGWAEDIPYYMGDSDLVFNAIIKPVEYEVFFYSQDKLVGYTKYTAGDKELKNVPDVPHVPYGLNGKWEDYDLSKGGNIEIHAIYESPAQLSVSKQTLRIGESQRLLTFGNYDGESKIWLSNDTSVATVDSHGNVTAISEGECTITVFNTGVDEMGNQISTESVIKIVVEKNPENQTSKDKFEDVFISFIRGILDGLTAIIKYLVPFIPVE